MPVVRKLALPRQRCLSGLLALAAGHNLNPRCGTIIPVTFISRDLSKRFPLSSHYWERESHATYRRDLYVMPASGKTEETVSSVIGEALGKMGLSLAALLLLILFADYAEKYGWLQILALLALHMLGLLLLWNSASTGKVGPAIAALVLGVVWNAAAILYMIAESGPRFTINGVVETKPPTTEVVGTLFLTWWYISSIRKVNRFQ